MSGSGSSQRTHVAQYIMPDESIKYRQTNAENDIRELQQTVYGDRGLARRLDITEARLQIFWWVLAVLGTAAIGLTVEALYHKL